MNRRSPPPRSAPSGCLRSGSSLRRNGPNRSLDHNGENNDAGEKRNATEPGAEKDMKRQTRRRKNKNVNGGSTTQTPTARGKRQARLRNKDTNSRAMRRWEYERRCRGPQPCKSCRETVTMKVANLESSERNIRRRPEHHDPRFGRAARPASCDGRARARRELAERPSDRSALAGRLLSRAPGHASGEAGVLQSGRAGSAPAVLLNHAPPHLSTERTLRSCSTGILHHRRAGGTSKG